MCVVVLVVVIVAVVVVAVVDIVIMVGMIDRGAHNLVTHTHTKKNAYCYVMQMMISIAQA